jgi:hypothetical protein
VIYRKGGDLHVLFCIGVERIQDGGILTGASSQLKAAGDPTAFVGSAGINWVIYRSRQNARILGVSWKDGAPFTDELSGVAGAPGPAGDPVGHYTAHDDTHQVYYRDGDGNLWELFWQGNTPVQARNLTAATPRAVPATGTPTVFYSAGTNTHHVIYSANGGLHDIHWRSRAEEPDHLDLTIAPAPAPSADRLAGFTVEGPTPLHVAYRGANNPSHIHEVRWG